MNCKSLAVGICFACVPALLASPGWADTFVYGDLPGTSLGEVDFVGISETSDTDPLPLFGTPSRAGNRLYFFPTNFVSLSQDGSTDTTSSTLNMSIVADAGYYIERVTIIELGDYILTGSGTDATYADVSGTLTVTPGGAMPLVVAPPTPYYGPASGSFDGSAMIDLTGQNVTQVDLAFENILATGSESQTTAQIQKNIVNVPTIEVSVIPEPACGLLLFLGGLGLIRRRRR